MCIHGKIQQLCIFICVTGNAANKVESGDTGINQIQILDHCPQVNLVEHTGEVGCRTIHYQARDGVALSIVRTNEGVTDGSNTQKSGSTVLRAGTAGINIGRLDKVLVPVG